MNTPYLTSALNLVPGMRKSLAAALDADDERELRLEATGLIAELEMLERLLALEAGQRADTSRLPKMGIIDLVRTIAGVWLLGITVAVTPIHRRTIGAMSMVADAGLVLHRSIRS
ncbi:hypothetical protein CPT_Sansa62 [Caulobacter phage Sansa]|uniref:Uncharacterized protein n=1 Tax=Caulobacter phage Sansa TaxID=1675600 RepID=A0A0K1LLT8_9CAUD|nr:hypothetical protein HOR07_gp062 [Caulobacter phage Sansa]AKU43466.1 hypothetical protein CPT_Sansa62 [Caulobacter phage Sansa]